MNHENEGAKGCRRSDVSGRIYHLECPSKRSPTYVDPVCERWLLGPDCHEEVSNWPRSGDFGDTLGVRGWTVAKAMTKLKRVHEALIIML